MFPEETIGERRSTELVRLFPGGLPTLWCPALTHYGAEGGLDRPRIAKHLWHIAPWAKGLLVAGSTGDGWESDAAEQRQLLDLVLDIAAELHLYVLAGVLRRDAADARQAIIDTLTWLKDRRPSAFAEGKFVGEMHGLCGFTVCPPTGRDLPQAEIRDGLATILEFGVRTALYQLPQVTLNEMSPETVAELAARYPNFFMLKDTSGRDRIATAGLNLGGVRLVRGAEGDYDRWLQAAGGPYAGFLLSTANCFAEQLGRMIELLQAGRREEARQTIAPVEAVVARVFALVADLPQGNAFTNANKAIDHFMAHGSGAAQVPPPRLHAGATLPAEVITATGEALSEHALMPEHGYLED